MGATNLVAARSDGTSTVRPASVPWRGSALTGFVERVGDPVPIVAPDGSAHDADRLLIAAVTDLIRTAGRPGEPSGIALPAHWRGHVVDRMRGLLPGVVSSDAVAALTALRAHPGLPGRGVIVLCDFGATGTNVTLADASDLRTIGATVRLADFSGEAIDRSLLAYLLADLDVDAASTSAVASLTDFRLSCRMAKERLSFQTATGLPGPRPGTTVRLTRAELESLVRGPLDAVLAEIEDMLARNGVRPADLVAVASVGGGSRIPVVTQRLSEALRMPVTTTPQAQSVAAIGAALIAGREPEMVTRAAVLPRLASVPPVPETPHLLAWSTADVAEPVEFADVTRFTDDLGRARPDVSFVSEDAEHDGALGPLAWYRRPAVLFAGAACAAVLAAAGLVVTTDVETVGTASAASVVSSVPSEPLPSESGPAPIAAAPEVAAPDTQTVVVTPQPSIVRYTQAPQAQAPAPQAPPQTVTTTAPTTSTTTTTTPTTTTPTTTTPTTTEPTTTVPPPTTVSPPSTVSSTVAPPPSTPPPSTPPPSTPPPSTATATETVLTAEPSQPITAGDTASASR